MPIDPNISLQVGNNVRTLDPLTAYGQVLTLKNAIDAQRLNSLQYDRTQRAMEDEQAVRGAYSVTPDGQVDEPATIRNLVTRGFGPQAVEVRNKFSTDRLANQKAEREAEKSQYEMLGKRIELVSQGLGALGENPTYEQAVQVGQWLNANGVKYDVAELPKDPEQLAAYIQQKRMQALTAKEQLAENAPTSPLGKLLRDQRRDQERTRALMAQDQASIEGQGQVDESGALVAPRINVAAPPDPYAPAIAREQYGPADAPFRYGKGGQIEAVPQVQDYRLAERRAGAPVNNVNMGRVEQSSRIETNKDFITNEYRPAMQADEAARKIMMAADSLEKLNFKSGKLAPTKAAMAGVLSAFGVASKDIEQYASDAQKFNTFLMERNWDVLNAAKGPQTEGDAQRGLQTFLMLENTPEANKFIADYARVVNKRARAKAKFYRDNLSRAQADGDLQQLEQQWSSSPEAEKSIWEDPIMKKWEKTQGSSGVKTYDPATGTFK